MIQTSDLVGSVAALGLDTGWAPPVPSKTEWNLFLRHVRQTKLTGLLATAILVGEHEVTDQQYEDVARVHAEQSAWVLTLERHMIELVGALADRGVETRVLKGSALAHLDYGRPSQRCFADVDLMVRAERFADAADLLASMGGVRSNDGLRPRFDLRFVKGATIRLESGAEVDLHRTLVLGWFGLAVDPEDCFASAREFTVGGERMLALPDAVRLVHGCIHASLGERDHEWMPLRDVAELVLGCQDIGPVLELARRWRCEIVVADAVTTAWERLRIRTEHDLVRWARSYRRAPQDAAHLAGYRGQSRTSSRLALSATTALPKWRDRVVYLSDLALPGTGVGRIPSRARIQQGWTTLRSLGRT